MRQRIIEMFRTTGQYVAITLCLPLFAISGCGFFPESSFDLAPDSRLPKWFAVPPGLTRSQVTARMDYYNSAWGSGSATFRLLGPNGDVLAKASGALKEHDPNARFSYPAYEVITINGVTDIVKHLKMEPLFYVTDDPSVWAELAPKR
jgi:hypothetical protein